MTTSWAGKTLTWNNRPGHTAGTAETKSQSLKNYNFNVTAIVNAWYNGSPKYGFMISYYNEGARDLNSLYSSDCGNNTYLPVLTFNYVTGPALSAVTAGVYYIRNQYSGKYIDVNGQYTTAGANVHQWSFHGGPSQQWKITHVGNNWYTIRPQHAPGMAMDVLDNSPNNTANIIQHKFHGARCQQFGFIKNANGSYRIVTKTTNGTRCLAVQYALTTDGGNIFQYNYGSQANDHWFLELICGKYVKGKAEPPIASHIANAKAIANQEYNVWPAGSTSYYYGKSDSVRHSQLSANKMKATVMASGGAMAGMPDAARMIIAFTNGGGLLDKNNVYNLDFKRMNTEWNYAGSQRKSQLNEALAAAEALIASGETATIYTYTSYPNNNKEGGNWYYAVGAYWTRVKCVVNRSSNSFNATIYYYMNDYYDWDKSDDSYNNLPCTPSEMWELHHGGYAREYEVRGTNILTVQWTKGQRIGSGANLKDMS